MSLVINHNMMAMNASRNMNASYTRLADSTRKLSSGLRIGTAADDAAGLAIRELMRSDIATLNQGVRNSNDAISLIQTADGALQIIDEKLIRMKELAEQASTGTYDSVQRGIIESEYQQMASEITRIASATDFNGIKLLDGSLSAADMSNPGAAHKGNGVFKGTELALADLDGKLKEPLYVNDGVNTARPITTLDQLEKELELGKDIYTNDHGAEGKHPASLITGNDLEALQNTVKQDKATLDKIYGGTKPELVNSTGKLNTPVYIVDPADKTKALEVTEISELERHLDTGTKVYTSLDTPGDLTAGVDVATEMTGNALDKFQKQVKQESATIAELWDGHDIVEPTLTTLPPLPTLALLDADGKLATPMYRQTTEDGIDGETADDKAATAITTLAELEAATAKGYTIYPGNTGGGKNEVDGTSQTAAAINTSIADDKTALATYNTANAAAIAANTAATAEAAAANMAAIADKTIFISDSEGNLNAPYYIKDAATGEEILVDNIFDLQKHLENDIPVFAEDLTNPGKAGAQIADDPLAVPPTALTDLIDAVDRDVAVLEDNENWDLTSRGPLKVHFGTGNDSSEDYYYIAIADSTAAALGVGNSAVDENGIPRDGHDISTQENAQKSLEALNAAIVSKDNIRAHLGAMQNRLENTINNITIQAENMQAAESRISDVNVSTEMTEFVRNQVLSNAAVSMLSQANQLPQMAMKLLG